MLSTMTDIAALSRLIENLLRLGTVAEVDHGSLSDKRSARVRVQSGELLTGWLPWAASCAGTTRDGDPPTMGEQVLVLIPANHDRAERHRRRIRQCGSSTVRHSDRRQRYRPDQPSQH